MPPIRARIAAFVAVAMTTTAAGAAMAMPVAMTTTAAGAAMAMPVACPPAPVAVAHRGGTEVALENTLGAFRSAGAAGVDRWELDVRFDVRGTPVVLHDATVDRVSPRTGRIADLDTTDRGVPTDDGQYVPSLRETYAAAVQHDAVVLTEFKVMPTETQWRAVAAEIDGSVGRDRVILMSFDRETVLAARQWIPGAPTGLLHNAGYLHPAQVSEFGEHLMKAHRVISESRARDWSAGGISVWAWTVDDEQDWDRLAAWPVTGMITDRPIAYAVWASSRCGGTG